MIPFPCLWILHLPLPFLLPALDISASWWLFLLWHSDLFGTLSSSVLDLPCNTLHVRIIFRLLNQFRQGWISQITINVAVALFNKNSSSRTIFYIYSIFLIYFSTVFWVLHFHFIFKTAMQTLALGIIFLFHYISLQC